MAGQDHHPARHQVRLESVGELSLFADYGHVELSAVVMAHCTRPEATFPCHVPLALYGTSVGSD